MSATFTPRKTVCPISRAAFTAHAEPVEVVIEGQSFDADVKRFSTGSFGWYLTGKTTVVVNGVRVPVQMGVQFTVIGSKELPTDTPPAAPALPVPGAVAVVAPAA